ncbi:GumC family protein [Brevundimonas nasdae]|uniref:non-specific protein-tyrosine kinase n=1 Tax=Brevundimonas nasdae TaxID=172043 RepID=A0ABX8TCS2_9CAUL|nr:polysaccharide biosynthesis tyrosine autokinase [Brevundimonas nasdae]QYC08978.1 polysaccharide biosynthesis tyrosine autokinase [Brevundimonas nasdae]QYC15028.1 polysaccharide biosynthesis tyrosine autokinase [Brevundimonas nasdae]
MNQIFDARSAQAGSRGEPSGEWGEGGGWSASLGQAIDLHRLIAVFRRRLKLFLAVAILVMVATIVVTVQATPLYTATANLMIDTRKAQVVDSAAVLSGLSADSSVVDTEVEILKSRQLAERVVDTLKLQDDPEFNNALGNPGPIKSVIGGIGVLFGAAAPDAARDRLDAVAAQKEKEQVVDAVLKRLSIRRAGLTYVMNVGFASEDPAKAARIANTFADRYLLEQLEAKFDATRQANVWLNDRLGELRVEVQQADAAVAQYRAANNLLSSQGATLTEQEISTYNQQLATVRAQQAEEEARLRTARGQLAAGSTGEDVGEALGSQVVQQLRARRAEVSGRVADLSSRYGPRHPDMLRAQRELADIDSQIQAEIQRIISNLEARVQVARERTSSMASSLGGARGTLAANNAAGVRLSELERNAQSVQTLYQSFLDRFKETSASEGIEQSDARVVSRAKIPTKPSSPNIPLNLALGFVLAIGGGLAGVVLAEMLDSGLTTAEDVERKLGLPNLGSVPMMSSVADPVDRDETPVDYVLKKPLSGFAESVRALRASILYSRVGKQTKVITLTSALPAEGKTTTSVCLARVAAQSGARVVLVDCDLRRRNVNRLLGVEPEKGLIEVLNRSATLDQALLLDEPSGAYVLPLAKNSFTPKDVFGSEAMTQLIATLRESFDLVILDTAPVLAVADTRVLASRSDATVVLARWRKTPEKAIANALKLLEQSGAHVSGLALTQVDMNAQARYGYGDSGYYYSEYKKYYAS